MAKWYKDFYAAYSYNQVVISTTWGLAKEVASNPGGRLKKCSSYDEAFDFVTSFMDLDAYDGFGLLGGSKIQFNKIRYRYKYD